MSNKIKISKCKYCGKDIILNAAQRYRLKRNGYIYCNHKCSHRGHSNSYRKDISNEIIKKLHIEKELTPKQIANRLNCSASTIYFRLRKISIPIRRILHSDKYLVKICPICGKKFHTYLSQETKTCGYRCGAILRCDIKGRQKKIKRKCRYCGREFEIPPRFATEITGWYCSYICRGEASKGKKHHNWKDGISKEPYAFEFNKQLKESIRLRDGYRCQKCGCPEIECIRKLDIHHIDFDKKNCLPFNLISLCSSCNSKVNFNRSKWITYFNRKVKKIMASNAMQLNFNFSEKKIALS